jgi:integrase
MASIDHPKGKPRVRWKDPDGTPRTRTCATERAARDLHRAVQWCEDVGRVWKPEEEARAPSLRTISERWIEACDRRLAPRYVDGLGQKMDAFLDWYEGRHGAGAPAAHLSRALLEAYWDHVKAPATGRYVHSRIESTTRKHLEAVHLLWEWAADREEYGAPVGGSPVVPPVRKMDLPRKPATTPRAAPTWAEMDMAIDAAEGWRRCAMIVMRCTGLRVQQGMGLRWTDVHGSALTIRGELGKSHQERGGRVVPVAPVLLAEWASPRLAEWSDPEWIIPCPLPHRIVRSRDIARIWERTAARAAAWEGRPDHAFRAGLQTGLRALGVAREATEYLVGHAMPGLDANYIDPDQALHLTAAVAKVPAMAVAPSLGRCARDRREASALDVPGMSRHILAAYDDQPAMGGLERMIGRP